MKTSMKFKAIIMILGQTISSIGFGTNIICLYVFTLPGGYDTVAKILERPDSPIMPIVGMTILCFVFMAVLTFRNIDIVLTAINKTESK